jgi:hypothetical protein
MDIVIDRSTKWLNYVKFVSSTIESSYYTELISPDLQLFLVTFHNKKRHDTFSNAVYQKI